MQNEIDKINSVTGIKPAVLVYSEGSMDAPIFMGMVVGVGNEHVFLGTGIGAGNFGNCSCNIMQNIYDPTYYTFLIKYFELPT